MNLMFWLKKKLPIFILLLIVYGWYFITQSPVQKNARLDVLGANTNIQLFVQPQDGREEILNAINSAQREVLVEVYLLSDKQIISAIEDARGRGVSVKVMMEEHPFGGGNINKKTEQELTSDGVPFRWTNPEYKLTHEKVIIIDANKVFILNQNLTASSFSKNREYNVIDTDIQDVTEARNIFIADWERKSYQPPNTHLIVSPKNSRAGIMALLEGATKSINVEIEDINDNEIVFILSYKAKSIPVMVLTPTTSQVSSNSDALKKLQKAGVVVKIISTPFIHAKLILVDDRKAYVGSVNLSSQSMDENRELGIILTQQDAISTLFSNFNSDWQKGTLLN